VVVRPDDVTVAPGEPDAGTPNCVHVVVDELLNVGSQVKVVARTGDGAELVARVRRGDALTDSLTPGRGAWLRFAPEAAHVYPPAAAS
jgi:hypothetical protein